MGAKHTDMARIAILQMYLAHVVIHNADHEVQLQVRSVLRRVRFEEGTTFRKGRGKHARPVLAPLHPGFEKLGKSRGDQPNHVLPFGMIAHHVIQMVLQILANAGTVMADGDPMGVQLIARADTAEHQELRRAEGTGAEDHLFARLYGFDLPDVTDFHPGRTTVLQHHATRLRLGQDRQVRTVPHVSIEIGCSGRAALALGRAIVKLGDLIIPRAFQFRAVEIRVVTNLLFARCINKGLRDGSRFRLFRHLQRSIRPMQIISPAHIAFGLFEVRQDGGPIPAFAAQIGPFVVVLLVPPHIQHRIDGRGPAQRLTARLKPPPPVQPRLRDCPKSPVVDLGTTRNHCSNQSRRTDEDVAPVATCFD